MKNNYPETKKIGRTTYLIQYHYVGKYRLEKVLERLILSDKSLY